MSDLMRDPIDPNEGPSAVIHGREDKPRTGSESLLLREADRSQVVEEAHAYCGIEHKMPGPFADCLLCEVERLQRIVSGVKSKTALDVVAEKMAAEDHAKELARQLEQVEGERERLRAGINETLMMLPHSGSIHAKLSRLLLNPQEEPDGA